MELKQLNTFLEVSRLLSFTQAADTLGYVQSAVTTQIQLLEKELGVKLFERFGRSIALTPEGKRLRPYAEQILKLSLEAKNAVSGPNEPRGPLIIGAIESLCVNRIPELLKKYHTRYPNVDIVLKFGTCTDFRRSLRDNTMDLAFFLDRKIEDPDLVTVLSFPEPVVALATKEHRLASKQNINPKDLSDETLILTEPGCSYRNALTHVMNRFAVRPRSIMETGNVQAIKQLVMSGLGITFLPEVAVKEELEQKRLADLKWNGPDFDMLTQAVHHKNKWISASMTAFFELMRDHFEASKP